MIPDVLYRYEMRGAGLRRRKDAIMNPILSATDERLADEIHLVLAAAEHKTFAMPIGARAGGVPWSATDAATSTAEARGWTKAGQITPAGQLMLALMRAVQS
jgi:hypothetical protein